ncbi:MAG: hypothetical protein KDC24_14635 [Saprospiraceae bacterium]|nr:hypothetical protein [Saprospiraceae bacterium]
MKKSLKDIFGKMTGLDDRSLKSLTNALENANLPGFDYLEFKQSVNALQEMGMDDKTAFKSAFAAASTMGLTKEKLIETAKHYTKVLAHEMDLFDKACKSQIEQKVNSKKTEVEALKGKIAEYEAKIEQLKERIQKSQATIDEADENIKGAMDKIQGTKESFDFTFKSVLNQITVDIEQIEGNI